MQCMMHSAPTSGVCINHPLAVDTLNNTSNCMGHIRHHSVFGLVVYATSGYFHILRHGKQA